MPTPLQCAISWPDQLRIQAQSLVSLKTIRRAYGGQSVVRASWERITQAALSLNLPPPGPWVPPDRARNRAPAGVA
jgi:hypothetical protein